MSSNSGRWGERKIKLLLSIGNRPNSVKCNAFQMTRKNRMLRPFRTNSPLTRLVAMVIFIASVLPVIGHACMMAEAHATPTVMSCCCDEVSSLDMDIIDGRECDDEREPSISVQGDCCLVDLQPIDSDAIARMSKASLEENIDSVPLLQVRLVFFEPAPPRIERRLQDTGPPPSLPSLRILHSCFLI